VKPKGATENSDRTHGSAVGTDSGVRTWPILWRTIRASLRYRTTLILSLLCGIVFAGSRYLRAYIARPLIDDILVPAASMSGEESVDLFQAPLVDLGVILAMTVLVSPVAAFGRGYLTAWVVSQVRRDFDQAVARKLMRIPIATLRTRSTGDLLARAIHDVWLACEVLTQVFRDVALSAIMCVTSLVVLLATSWPLALLTFATAPPLWLLLNFFGQRIHKQTRRRQETLGELSQRLTGILSGIKIIKVFQGYEIEEAAYARETDRFFKSNLKIASNRVMSKTTTEALTQIVAFVTLGIGAWLALTQQQGVTLGSLSAFSLILLTTYKPIKSLAASYSTIMETLAGAGRLYDLLDGPEEPVDRPNAVPMPAIRNEISFQNVSFDFGGTPILRDINLTIQRGEVVAFVGKTGAGKSTLIDLVLRFHDPTSGSIQIDGVDLRHMTRASFLGRVAVVTQEPFLFDVSIFENIRYGRPDATFEEVEAAAKDSGAAEFIAALPEGYDTPVGEFGMRLSGGQRQRATIARAILRNADLLVLDEATSALDGETEQAVQTMIDKLRGEHTLLLVSHRLSTIRSADRIFVVDAGRVTESGTHEELMANSAVYAGLFTIPDDVRDS
jgi:subfamily B ATP-binding cassette protein MsbA